MDQKQSDREKISENHEIMKAYPSWFTICLLGVCFVGMAIALAKAIGLF